MTISDGALSTGKLETQGFPDSNTLPLSKKFFIKTLSPRRESPVRFLHWEGISCFFVFQDFKHKPMMPLSGKKTRSPPRVESR